MVFFLIGVICTTGCVTISSNEEALTGALYVSSTPAGSSIYLDNVFKGTTPLKLENIPIGTYNLTIHTSGYDDWQTSVLIKSSETTSLSAVLTPTPKANIVVQKTGLLENWSVSMGTYYTASFVVYNKGDAAAKNLHLSMELICDEIVEDSAIVYIGDLAPGEQMPVSADLDGKFGNSYTVKWSTIYE